MSESVNLPEPEPRVALPLRNQVVSLALATLALIAAAFFAERTALNWSALPDEVRLAWMKRHPHPIRPLATELLTLFTTVWCFMLGGSFGSFLNCAAYRMPRGLSIVARPSACPACNANIRAWHNVPVLGWLVLGGRCAQCKWEIPVRYALVEFLFGGAFLALLVFVGYNGGWNLPDHWGPIRYGVENLWESDGSIVPILGVYFGMMVFLLTFSLFAWDGFRVPWVIAAIGIAAALAARWFVPLPGLRLPFPPELGRPPFEPFRLALDEFGDLTCGVLVGFLLTRRSSSNIRSGDAHAAILATVLMALIVGWPGLLGASLLTLPLRTAFALCGGVRLPLAASLTAATLTLICYWAFFLRIPLWPSSTAGPTNAVGAIMLLALGSAVLDWCEARYFASKQ